MCLITQQKKPTLVKKDKIVFKLLRQDLKPIMQSFKPPYILGELNHVDMKSSDDTDAFDTKETNSIRELGFNRRRRIESQPDWTIIGQGFHASLTKKRLLEIPRFYTQGYIIVRCMIPKGSKMYKSATGLTVSNQLIVQKVVNQL